MNFYDVLAAEKWDGGVPTINFFDLLFAQSLGGGEQWETYEGTLPATITANGDNMKQYQAWGNTGGVGTWDDTEQSYKLDMVSRTKNLFDISTSIRGKYIAADGSEGTSAMGDPFKQLNHSDFIEIRNNEEYYFSYYGDTLTGGQTLAMCWFDDSKIIITRKTQSVSSGVNTYVINDTAPSNAKYLIINFAAWNNNSHYMLNEGSTALPYEPYYNTVTSIYIGDTPLGADEYVDYAEQKVFRRTVQIMPSAPAETKTQNGITVTCDGEGRYSISGRATASVSDIRFLLPEEFTIPTSVGNGGNGTFSMFNTVLNTSIRLLYNNTLIDEWGCTSLNRTSTAYRAMANQKINAISFNVGAGTALNGVISPMITDNGTLPETYIPYLQPTDPPVPLPALPTIEGTTIVDYAGSGTAPEKVYFEYQGR